MHARLGLFGTSRHFPDHEQPRAFTPPSFNTMSSSTGVPDPAAEKAAREKEAAEQAALPYKWKQTIGEVDITVDVPPGTRGRDLVVEIKSNKLKVGLKGQEPILDVRLLSSPSPP